MEKDRASAILALANNPENLSLTAQIRALYPVILQAKKAGVSNAKLLLELNAQGLEMGSRTFINILYCIKKEGAINSPTHSPPPAKSATLFNDFVKPVTFKRTER
jgi:hypothetical protein